MAKRGRQTLNGKRIGTVLVAAIAGDDDLPSIITGLTFNWQFRDQAVNRPRHSTCLSRILMPRVRRSASLPDVLAYLASEGASAGPPPLSQRRRSWSLPCRKPANREQTVPRSCIALDYAESRCVPAPQLLSGSSTSPCNAVRPMTFNKDRIVSRNAHPIYARGKLAVKIVPNFSDDVTLIVPP